MAASPTRNCRAISRGHRQHRGAKEIGSDRAKLERDSPLKNAQKINIPVLLVHGTKDWQVQMDHTIEMSDKLDEFEKPNTTVIIKGANQISNASQNASRC